MQLSRRSRLARFSYFGPFGPMPSRTSLCAFFWQTFVLALTQQSRCKKVSVLSAESSDLRPRDRRPIERGAK